MTSTDIASQILHYLWAVFKFKSLLTILVYILYTSLNKFPMSCQYNNHINPRPDIMLFSMLSLNCLRVSKPYHTCSKIIFYGVTLRIEWNGQGKNVGDLAENRQQNVRKWCFILPLVFVPGEVYYYLTTKVINNILNL